MRLRSWIATRSVPLLFSFGAALVVGCHDATSPQPALSGTWRAVRIGSDTIPANLGCTAFNSECTWLVDAQLRFRTRGRLIDVRRFRKTTGTGTPIGDDYDKGNAYAFHVPLDTLLVVERPFADTGWADSAVVHGDTLRLWIRKLDPDFGGLGSGRGVQVTYVKTAAPS